MGLATLLRVILRGVKEVAMDTGPKRESITPPLVLVNELRFSAHPRLLFLSTWNELDPCRKCQHDHVIENIKGFNLMCSVRSGPQPSKVLTL